MSRPTIVYLVMIVALVTGLWAALHIGAKLNAPEDLAGHWQLRSVTTVPVNSADAMTIEQSGEFFQISIDKGPQLALKLMDSSATTVHLAHGDWKMTVTGQQDSDDKTIELTGPRPGRWTAHRNVRTFPSDVAGKEAA